MISPAPKYIWVIKFNREDELNLSASDPKETNYPAEMDLFIPATKENKEKWQRVSDTIEIQALEFLSRIQKMCDRIKEECSKDPIDEKSATKSQEDSLKNAKYINQSIQNLEKLVARFNEILKRLNKPPPPPAP